MLYFLALFLTTTQARAAGKTFEIYVVGHFPPLINVQENKVDGLLPALITRVLQPDGIKPVFIYLPWKRAQVRIHQSPQSAIIGVKSPEREAMLHFSKHWITRNKQVLVRMNSPGASAEKVPNALVKMRGYVSGFEKDLQSYGQPLEVDSLEQGFKVLMSARAHWMLGNELSLTCLARQLKLDVTVDKVLGETEVYLASSRNFGPELLNRFDASLEREEKRGLVTSESPSCDE